MLLMCAALLSKNCRIEKVSLIIIRFVTTAQSAHVRIVFYINLILISRIKMNLKREKNIVFFHTCTKFKRLHLPSYLYSSSWRSSCEKRSHQGHERPAVQATCTRVARSQAVRRGHTRVTRGQESRLPVFQQLEVKL